MLCFKTKTYFQYKFLNNYDFSTFSYLLCYDIGKTIHSYSWVLLDWVGVSGPRYQPSRVWGILVIYSWLQRNNIRKLFTHYKKCRGRAEVKADDWIKIDLEIDSLIEVRIRAKYASNSLHVLDDLN